MGDEGEAAPGHVDTWEDIFGDDPAEEEIAEPPRKAARVADDDADSMADFIDDEGASAVDPDDVRHDPPPSSDEEGERGGRGRGAAAARHVDGPMTGFDEALIRLKPLRPKANYKPEVKDSYCQELCKEMEDAEKEDRIQVQRNKPATKKLGLLPKVERTVMKAVMQESFIKEGGLNLLSHWLRPMPETNMIPNLKIRSVIFRALESFEENFSEGIELNALKESEIGKTVLFYYKLPQETRENRQRCSQLCQRWLNTIVSGSRHYNFPRAPGGNEDRDDDERPAEPVSPRRLVRNPSQTDQLMHEPKSLMEVNERIAKSNGQRHARMPRRETHDYYVQPPKEKIQPHKRDPNSHQSNMTRKLVGMQSRAARAPTGRASLGNINVSLEGRGMHREAVD